MLPLNINRKLHMCQFGIIQCTYVFFQEYHFSNANHFSSAWLCQQISWNRNLCVVCRPSSVRPPVSQLSLNLMHGRISSKFWLLLPLRHTTLPSNQFWILSNFFWIFFPVVLQKVLFCIFEILSFRFLTNFLNSQLYPMGKPKPQLSGKWATVERNGVKFGPRGE